jgi:hypothetical protein
VLISGQSAMAGTWPLGQKTTKTHKPTAPAPWCDYRSAMGSIRRPSETVVQKRRAVAVAFASALRELQASGVVARRAIADELNRRGVPTERNGRWHYTTVVRMLARLGMVKPAPGRGGAGAANRQASLVRAQTLAPLIRQIQSGGDRNAKSHCDRTERARDSSISRRQMASDHGQSLAEPTPTTGCRPEPSSTASLGRSVARREKAGLTVCEVGPFEGLALHHRTQMAQVPSGWSLRMTL